MEQLDDEELLTKRNAKEYFDLSLNLVDKDELLEAITTLEKAISLQPNNELYTEFSQYLKETQSLSMEDSCKCTRTSNKHESYQPLKETDTNVFSFNGPQKQRTFNEEKREQNRPTGKCSHCSSNCNGKHSNCSSEIPEKEETEPSESLFDDISKEEERDSSSDCENPRWFPNPAKYNVEGFDIDARFLEEVCKQRESADGWDTYMKLISDRSQDDDDTSDESDDIDNLDVQNIGSINDYSDGNGTNHLSESTSPSKTTCERNEHTKERDEEKKSRVESSSSIGSTCEEIKSDNCSENNSSHPKVTKEASENDEKERLYFMNGNGYYGIPPFSSDATASSRPTKSKPSSSKPKMDPSENDFYQNLRFYFNVYDSKSDFLNRNKESVSKEAGSTNKPDGGGRSASATKEEKVETPASGSDRTSTPQVDKEKNNTRSSSSRTTFDKQQSKDTTNKAEMPKVGNSSDRKGKKGHKTTAASEDNSNSQQTKTKTKLNKKHKHKASESTRQNKHAAVKEKTSRTTKEEKIKKKISNSSESDVVKEWSFRAVKKVGAALLWLLYYAILILLVVVIFTAQCLIAILKLLVGFIMSWRISVVVVNKLSHWTGMVLVWMIGSYYSCKTKCIRWYYGIKTFGFKDFFFRSERPAQTYNLPNSGEDAIQQLLMKRDSDPYSILGVPKDASNDDIRKQYRKLAVLVHPDKNSHVHSAEAFRVLSGAYDVIGDPEKRQEFDTEVARREAFQQSKSQNPPRDFSDPTEVFAEFLRQMEEIRESLSCDVCDSRHRRILTDRDVIHARRCYHCNRMHPAKEGDFWKESTYMGFGRSKFYACMEGRVYDISEWGHCQERNGFSLPSDTHRVLGRISTRPRHPTPPTSRLEEELWRELFGHPDRYDGNHGNQGNRNKQQRSRRRKRR